MSNCHIRINIPGQPTPSQWLETKSSQSEAYCRIHNARGTSRHCKIFRHGQIPCQIYRESFSPNISHESLLKVNVVFTRGPDHEKEFNELKKLLSSQLLIQFYNPQLLIKISCDMCKKGLGAILEQQQEEQWISVAYASRAITETQSRYALIEREALMTQFTRECFHQYIYGRPVQLETDHKPLVAIFKKSTE